MSSVMVARALSVSSSPPMLHPSGSADASVLSCGTLGGGTPVDLHRYRTVFPDRWQSLLKHHFNSDLRRVMFFFDVSERCARDWIAGRTGPNGPAAIIAASRIPGAVEYLMAA